MPSQPGREVFAWAGWLCLCALLLLPGCSGCESGTGGSVQPTAGQRCTDDRDCFNGFRCDLAEGACHAVDDTVDGDRDAGGDEDAGPDVATDSENLCLGPGCFEPCSPTCLAGEECIDTVCVCVEGAQRPCGNKAGECRYGLQTCAAGDWGECEGGIGPVDEVCDHLDNDCDGLVDEGVESTFYADGDGDAHGDPDLTRLGCQVDQGYVAVPGDCDDANDAVHDNADEVCDGLDNDCNGEVDEEVTVPFYRDADEDGYGDPLDVVIGCTPPDGTIAESGDCDDDNADVHPGVEELCDGVDNDCNGVLDADDDFLGAPDVSCLDEGVCLGTLPSCAAASGWVCIYPPELYEADEVLHCDGFDNDCDGQVDEGLLTTYYLDADHDGAGATGSAVPGCEPPSARYVTTGGDCNDTNPAIHPGAAEVCDGLDNDCDGQLDAADSSLAAPTLPCLQSGVCIGTNPTCRGADGWRCEYTSPAWEAGDETRCDALDNDCDGSVDEGITAACGTDVGICTSGIATCELGEFVRCTGTAGIPPTDDETIADACDGLDNDCDGRTDEGCACTDGDRVACGSAVGACTVGEQLCVGGEYGSCSGQGPTAEVCDPGFTDQDCNGQDDIQQGLTTPYYVDADGDGVGAGALRHRCGPRGAGQVDVAGDCNDNDPNIRPGRAELCNGVDDNCDGTVDNNATGVDITCNDRGVCAGTAPTCSGAAGWSCNYDPALYEPTETTCDSQDNDCDGSVDEGLRTTWYRDNDRDGWGTGAANTRCGALAANEAPRGGDCNDNIAAVNPGAAEVCDGVDNNCVGGVDDSPVPSDLPCNQLGVCAGTQPTCGGSQGWRCTYTDPRYEATTETSCDTFDNDCDGQTDEGLRRTWYTDADRDGFGTGAAQSTCAALQAGQSSMAGDCNDSNAAIHPTATELCNGVDDNCNGTVDDNPTPTMMTCDPDGVCAGTLPTCGGAAGWRCVYTSPFFQATTETSCDMRDNDCDGQTDEGLTVPFYADGDRDGYGTGAALATCGPLAPGQSANRLDCDDSDRDINPDALEICYNAVDEDCDAALDNGCQACNATVDADFDGSNQCNDCDDTNGAVRPGATERCNGVDDDCDDLIDEDFDMDGDGWSVCAQNPAEVDCDDTTGSINPGRAEGCGADGTGNGVDDNCNGYIDEGCNPCNPADTDGDGISECQGDCAPTVGTIYPGAAEQCDGLDNDCNIYTTRNCDVSDPCNFPTADDVCRDELLCACVLDRSGTCTGNYLCTALCNTSETGTVGDGCEETQTCLYDLLRTANTHGCAEITGALGAKHGGEFCGTDDECRSNSCVRVFTGRDSSICYDFCGSDDYCDAPDTVCRLGRTSENLDGRCWPAGAAGTGSGAVGTTCTADSQCDHGLCSTDGAVRTCTEPCCSDADCGGGFTCSLKGDAVDTTYVTVPPDASSCTVTTDCPTGMLCLTAENKCAWRLVETSPMCLKDVVGQGSRQAGAACAANSQCASNFCEKDLGVCIEVCCNDDACPQGLTCELQPIKTRADRATSARVCLNISTDDVLEPR